MEIIVGIILALSLLGNYTQHKQAKLVDQERQEEVEAHRHQLAQVIEVNKINADTLNAVEQALNDCQVLYFDTVSRVNDFREASALKDAAITDLSVRLNNTNITECRVPDWVSFGAGNKD
jgi:ribosome maturation protein Sdo1